MFIQLYFRKCWCSYNYILKVVVHKGKCNETDPFLSLGQHGIVPKGYTMIAVYRTAWNQDRFIIGSVRVQFVIFI